MALMFTQFFGALNDNVYKLSIALIALQLMVTQEKGAFYISLGSALFVLPFILFAPYGGYLADRFSKSKVIQMVKVFEIIVMGTTIYAFANNLIYLMFGLVFLMGLQSALFGPARFGIMPEILERKDLSKGNGYLQFWALSAIIVGTALAGQLVFIYRDNYSVIGYIVTGIAVFGFTSSLFIKKTPALRSQKKFEFNSFHTAYLTLKEVFRDKNMFLTFVALSYFSFIGSLFQMNVLLYAKQVLLVEEDKISYLFLSAAAGIGLGSVIAGKISEGKVELGLVPMGAFGLSVFCIAVGSISMSYGAVLACLFCIGFCFGLYVVPLQAFVQHYSPDESRGRYLAANSFLSFSSILLASITFWVLKEPVGLSSKTLFLLSGLATLVILWIMIKVLPIFFVRCINYIIAHTFYRMRIIDSNNVPESGGALLVANHASYADASLIMASIDRPVRFLIFRDIYEFKPLKPFAKAINSIPISHKDSPKKIIEALNTAREAIQNGELVCIFAEGGHTRTGQLLTFRSGFEKIMKGLDAPIIPVYMDMVWGSILNYKGGKYLWKIPERLPYPVTLSFGKPLSSDSKASAVRQAVQELSSESFQYRKEANKLLHIGFLNQAKMNLFKDCMTDTMGLKLNYAKVLAGSLGLSTRLKSLDAPQKMVGVLLPSSVAASLTNIALLIAGKVPVNLNFTASKDSVDSAIKQCDINTIITSKRFIDKIAFKQADGMIFIEDILAKITFGEKIRHLLCVFLLPQSVLRAIYFKGKIQADDTATVIFSSGSTGEPKGVLLSHANLSSNTAAVYEIVDMKPNDAIVGILPLFHSFGFTGTLWLPLLAGIKVVYHANPLDAGVVGKMVGKEKGTILMATPTFLSAYIRKCTKEQFSSLRYVIVGAEKLKDNIARSFEDKFGITLYEGYGATELSPITALNIPDYREKGIYQVGSKQGTIGRPISGVAVKVVHPETNKELEANQDGLLMVKGPNVMKGYLEQPEKTKEVMDNGWYKTGDIANIDDDGFVMITDRLSRFSKIGGEMVPHIKVEEALHEALDSLEHMFSVASVPDERKGEKLVVLYKADVDVDALSQRLTQAGLPSLWIPKRDQFYRVDSFPMLGSGKVDLKAIKRIALEKAGMSDG